MSTEENHASGRPFSGRCPPSGRKPIPRPRSSAWRVKLPRSTPTKSPPNRRTLPHSAGSSPSRNGSPPNPRASSNSSSGDAHSTASLRSPRCRQTPDATRSLRHRRLRILSEPQSMHFARHAAAAPRSPPSRPSIRQRSQPPVDRYRSETGCASDLAYPGPSSSAMTARTPNPLFVGGPPIHAGVASGRSDDRHPQRQFGAAPFRRTSPALTPRPGA